jgi:hypothetical protein
MSRGPGRIQRAIEAVFQAEPDNALLLSELCERVYSGVNRIEKKHRIAVARAARTIPRLECWHRETLGRELVIFDPCNLMSYAMARLKADSLGSYERNNDPRGGRTGGCSRTEADLRSLLAPGGEDHKYIVPGGAWFDDVKENQERRAAAGNPKKLAKIEARAERRQAKMLKNLMKAFGQ